MSRRREAALVVTLALVTTAALTYPLAFRLGHGGRVDSWDGLFSIWNIAWVARTVVAEPSSLFHANIFHPHTYTLAFSEANLVAGVLAAPAYWLTGNIYAAHNSAVLISFVLAFVGAYLLIRHLTGSLAAALVTAVLFTFCPFIFARSAHIQLLMTAGLPFSMLGFHRLVEQPGIRRGAELGLLLTITALACGYYGLFAGLMVGVGILFYATTERLWRSVEFWSGIGTAVVVGGLVTGVFFLPYMAIGEIHGSIARTLDEARVYSADTGAWLASPARAHGWLLARLDGWSEVLFPGFLLTALSAGGLAMALRPTFPSESRGAPTRAIRHAAWLYTIIGVLAAWASFGPNAGFYTLLFETIPGFGMLRAPARLGIVVSLCLAVAAGVAVTRLTAGRHGHWIAAALVLVGLAELAPVAYPHYEAPRFPGAYRILSKLEPGPVAEFPYYSNRWDFPRHSYYLVGSTSHWLPLVNGYSDLIPQDFRAEVDELARFPTNAGLSLLAARDTRYVVFHRELYDDASWRELELRIAGFSQLLPIFWDDDAWLYAITE